MTIQISSRFTSWRKILTVLAAVILISAGFTMFVRIEAATADKVANPVSDLANHADPNVTGTIAYYLNRMQTNGGIINLEPGTYNVSSALIIPSNITLRGSGPNSIIKFNGTVADNVIVTPFVKNSAKLGVSNVLLEDFTVEGNKSFRTNCIYFDAPAANPNTYITLRGLTIKSCGQQGLHMKSSKGVLLTDLFLASNGTDSSHDHNVYLRRVYDLTANNIHTTLSAGNGFKVTNSDNLALSNIVAVSNGVHGVRIDSSDNITVSTSTAKDNGGNGFYFMNDNDPAIGDSEEEWYNFQVVFDGLVSISNGGDGIKVDHGYRFVVSDSVARENDKTGFSFEDSKAGTVMGNVASDNNQSVSTYNGFNVTSTGAATDSWKRSVDIVFNGNRSSGSMQTYGFYANGGAATDYLLVDGNNFRGNGTGSIYYTGIGTHNLITDNILQ